MSNDSPFLEAAIGYAEMGIPVFLLNPRSKHPTFGSSGFHDGTTDIDQVRSWWSERPGCNVGGTMGNGLVCLDFDPPKDDNPADGREWLEEWEREHGKLPETATAVTGREGTHLFYRVDRPVPKSENGAIHVDIRGDGSYAMLAPSIHPETGNAVFWDLDPEEYGIADADDNVYALIEAARPPKEENGTRVKVKMPTEPIRPGERNSRLLSLGRSARAKQESDDPMYILSFLDATNKRWCQPPLDDSEIERLAESVCSVPPGYSEEVKEKLAKGGNGGGRSANHVSVAQRLLGNYSACYLDGSPAVFDGLTYRIGWNEVERCVLREWPNSKDRDRKEVVKYLDLTMPHETQSPPRYIGFANGVLDVETMELLSFSPRFRIPNVIPHDWNPDARSDLLDKTLKKIACGDPYIETNLCEFVGLCMYRSGKYAYSAILLGKKTEKASNGKSTYINLLKNVLGKDNFSALSLCDFGDKFNRQYLSGKLANLGDDISSEFTKGASLEVFKKAVSGDEIHTDVKNGKGYDFEPYCTIVLSANEFPKMENLDDGVLRRLFPIRFNAHFSSEDPDYNPDIKDEFKYSEEIAEAAIVRGVWGLKRVIDQRRPTDNDESRSMVKDIQTDNSNILQWLEDEQHARDEFVERTVGSAYEVYEKWCARSGVRNGYAKWQFSKKMCEHFKFRIKNTSRGGVSMRIFVDA